ncbi:MAG: hypothetical protein FJX74_09710 [Armatimonadetes bacterium]|nr:hypothetical protein [Armatimonadota bacterium]
MLGGEPRVWVEHAEALPPDAALGIADSAVPGGWGQAGWYSTALKAGPGDLYSGGARVRVQRGGGAGQVYVTLSWCGPDGHWIANSTRSFVVGDTDGQWVSLATCDAAPPGTATVQIGLRCDQHEGSALFDDAWLTECTYGQVISIPVPDGSAEAGSGQKPQCWATSGEGTFGWDHLPASGRRSLRLQRTSDHAGWGTPTLDLPQSDEHWLWLHFAMRAACLQASGRTRAIIAWFDATGKWLCNSEGPLTHDTTRTEWRDLEVWAMPPPEATRAQLLVRSDANSGAFWFDDARLEVLWAPARVRSRDAQGWAGLYECYLREGDAAPLRAVSGVAAAGLLAEAGARERAAGIVESWPTAVSRDGWSDAAMALARAHAADKQLPKAEDLLAQVVSMTPSRAAEAWWTLGDVRMGARSWQAALAAYDHAVQLGGWPAVHSHEGRAHCLAMMKDLPGALAALEEAAGDPRTAAAGLLGVAELSLVAGDFPRALCAAHGAIAVFPPLPDRHAAYYAAAKASETLGDWEGACRLWEEMEPLSPTADWRFTSKLSVAECLAQMGQVEAARDRLRALATVTPVGPMAQLAADVMTSLDGALAFASPNDRPSGMPLRGRITTPSELARPLLIVYGASMQGPTTDANRRLAEYLAERLANTHPLLPGATATPDTGVDRAQLPSSSLYLIGWPTTNTLLARLTDQLPIRLDADAMQVGQERFDARTHGVIFTAPNPLGSGTHTVVYASLSPPAVAAAPRVLHGWTDYVVYAMPTAGGGDVRIVAQGFFRKSGGRWTCFASEERKVHDE